MDCDHVHLDEALDVLRRENLRLTEARKAILAFMAESHGPRSVEDIHAAIGTGRFDLVTVYRNLEAFERAGIVQRMMLENGKGLFELIHENHHHHHIICRKCHRAERLDACEAERLEGLARDLGYTEVSHVLELYGVCQSCRDA